MIPPFVKIFNIGTDYIRDIFQEEVEISEKIDGSYFAFGLIDGELQMRSKGSPLFMDNPEKMFKEGMDYVFSVQDRLPPDVIIHGEYLKSQRHNTLKYNRVPKNHIILFGAAHAKEERFYPQFEDFAAAIDLETVPKWHADITCPDDLKAYLDRDSCLGGTKVEGVVVKNYKRQFLLGGQPMPLMAGKYVSEAFKEVHKDRWGKEEAKGSKWVGFCESFKTEARWQKAIQHLRDRGELTNTPQDIGKLLKEVNVDIETEEKEAIKAYLWNEYKRDVMRTATRGMPEWYKEKLLARSFNGD